MRAGPFTDKNGLDPPGSVHDTMDLLNPAVELGRRPSRRENPEWAFIELWSASLALLSFW